MASFDADLVRRWFDRAVAAPAAPTSPATAWAVVPTDEECQALRVGQRLIADGLDPARATGVDVPTGDVGGALDADPAPGASVAAAALRRYLEAFAAAVADTTRTEAEVASELPSGLPRGEAGCLSLVAGLNAGAAALRDALPPPDPHRAVQKKRPEPGAAEVAARAGVVAAEVMVAGAGVNRIAAEAAGNAVQGWGVGRPTDPAAHVDHRVRALICWLLSALEQESADPESAPTPAPCGALPGENLGRPFPAEVTFQLGLADDEVGVFAERLHAAASEVTIWPGRGLLWCHAHTDDPGEVVSHAFAAGTVFDLRITHRR